MSEELRVKSEKSYFILSNITLTLSNGSNEFSDLKVFSILPNSEINYCQTRK